MLSVEGKTLLIRADATSHIGAGHIMRCVALSQAWLKRGGEVTFVSHCESDSLRKLLLSEGFKFVSLESLHPDPVDLEQTVNLLDEFRAKDGAPWLVLDGYHFSINYQRSIRDAGFRLLIIDDYNHHRCYTADILLNQNIGAERFRYSCDRDTVLLLGTKYSLLRKEFLSQKRKSREQPEIARKVLVTLGGADPDNVILVVIRALKLIDVSGIQAKIVVGPSNFNGEALEAEIQKDSSLKGTFQIIRYANMPKLMAWADIAISAGGSTCWELAFMGVPFLILMLAENQMPGTNELEKQGVAVNLGWYNETDTQDIAHSIQRLLLDPHKRQDLSMQGQRLLDGRGVDRVLERVFPTVLTLRSAQADDCELVWEWANDPVARAASFESTPIPWETHKRWFETKIVDSECLFYIAISKWGQLVGQIRFDIEDDKALISVSLGSEYRGFGLGTKLIQQASKRACAERNLEAIDAWIKVDNSSSKFAFKNAGYREIKVTEHKGCTAILMRY